ncbi:putative PDGF/VEGF domain-containing protein 2 [Homarus americanus]|uniref:Putative PDGF/VEGF domain-containing protein 2 n=1 Tax=Homarus americanus TaxID=6706 RepID=A0A8J5JPX3_HOMAM|nr:putative PDGF/VEGF domain-containing protein 2 [Homarus americanus]
MQTRVCSILVVWVVLAMVNHAVSLPSHHLSIVKQVEELQELGCQPVLKKVKVTDLLDPADDLVDMIMFYPHAVAVRRCDEDCSYCGNNHGSIRGHCIATASEKKSFVVAYYDLSLPPKKHHRMMTAIVHTKCSCKS